MTDLDNAPDIHSNLPPDLARNCVPDTDAEAAMPDVSANAVTDTLSLDELESRMCLLAGRIAANECEFLILLAEYDERQGWGA